jgi:hypothetical protein
MIRLVFLHDFLREFFFWLLSSLGFDSKGKGKGKGKERFKLVTFVS